MITVPAVLITVAGPGGHVDIGVRSDASIAELAASLAAVLGIGRPWPGAEHRAPPRPGEPGGRRAHLRPETSLADAGVADGDLVIFGRPAAATGQGAAAGREAGDRGPGAIDRQDAGDRGPGAGDRPEAGDRGPGAGDRPEAGDRGPGPGHARHADHSGRAPSGAGHPAGDRGRGTASTGRPGGGRKPGDQTVWRTTR